MEKKIIRKLISIALLLTILVTVLLINSTSKKLNYIASVIEIDLNHCKFEMEKDNHGGFLGDGEYIAKIKCTEQQDKDIKCKWKPLPMSCKLIHGEYTDYIPNIQDGYFFIYDRHSESSDSSDEAEIMSKSTYNFSLGIYDSKNKILYFYELDT